MLFCNRALISSGDNVGSASSNTAAIPAINGEAKDVPDSGAGASPALTFSPGAAISGLNWPARLGPRDEKDDIE